MKHVTASAILVLGLLLAAPRAAAPQQVTLLHVNDTHSHLAAWGPKDANLDGTLGGLPKAAAIIAAEKAANPNALFVHAGDFMNGDLFFNEYLGVPELKLLKSLGLDAMVLGNRDFQFGPGLLASVYAAAWTSPGGGVPILGTNLTNPQGHELGKWLTPALIKEVNGVKVGLLGLTYYKPTMGYPAPLGIVNHLTVAPAAVAALRAGGANVVVCVTHLGMERARALAKAVGGIDVIVNAHDNVALPQPEVVERAGGGTTLIVSAGAYYRFVGRLRLAWDGDKVSLVDYALLGADADAPAHEAVQATIDELKEGIVDRYGDVYHEVLAWAGQDIEPAWDPDKAKRDTPLGNLLTDAYRAWTSTDIAIEALAILDDALPRGAVVGADVFRAMSWGCPDAPTPSGPGSPGCLDPPPPRPPWERIVPWRLTTFRATGADLISVFEKLIAGGALTFPQVSGLRMDYDSHLLQEKPPKPCILLDTVHVNGHRLVADQLYRVTATEGVLVTLKGKPFSLPVYDVTLLPDLAFDAARDLVQERGELGPAASNRIRDIAVIPGKAH